MYAINSSLLLLLSKFGFVKKFIEETGSTQQQHLGTSHAIDGWCH